MSPQSSYFADASDPMELARLLRQDRLATKHMGLFPKNVDPSSLQRILDVACGTGGWALDVAQRYPCAQVVGIDIEPELIKAAQRYAQAEPAGHVTFREMDARQALDFADNSFDFVQVRFAQSFLTPQTWPKLLGECMRVLAPGGIIHVADHEISITTSQANERLGEILSRAMWRAGRTYSQIGRSFGTAPALRQELLKQGFVDLRPFAHVFDVSSDVEDAKGWFENFAILFRSIKLFLVQYGSINVSELDQLFDQAMSEIQQENYGAVVLLMSWVGKKP